MLFGAATIKLLPSGFDQSSFGISTPYWLKFGPERIGPNNAIVLEIVWNDKRGVWKVVKSPPEDESSHIYRLNLNRDGSYKVVVDQTLVASGEVENDFEFTDLDDPVSDTIGGVGFDTYMLGEKVLTGYVMLSNNEEDLGEYTNYFVESIQILQSITESQTKKNEMADKHTDL